MKKGLQPSVTASDLVFGLAGHKGDGGTMGYTVGALKQKINDMYPEIEENGILIGLVFNEDKNAYFINFRKGRQVFATHLQKNETDACMDGVTFTHLDSKIGRWMKYFTGYETQITGMRSGQSAQAQKSGQELYSVRGREKDE